MPCDSIVTNSVDLTNVGDHDLLEKTLKEVFGRVYRNGGRFEVQHASGYGITIIDGKASSPLSADTLAESVNLIKKEYSRNSVFATASRFKWLVKPGKDRYDFTIVKN